MSLEEVKRCLFQLEIRLVHNDELKRTIAEYRGVDLFKFGSVMHVLSMLLRKGLIESS